MDLKKRLLVILGLGGQMVLIGLLLRLQPQPLDTPSGYPRSHPEEVQIRLDSISNAYRAFLPDGREEIICENGVRRPLYRWRFLLYSKDPPVKNHPAWPVLQGLPDSSFPLYITAKEAGDTQPLLFNIKTGEIFSPGAE